MYSVQILFLVGRPHSGKSTQSGFLSRRVPGVYVISAGDWLRKLQENSDTALGEFVLNNWNHDSLTPLVSEFLDKTVGQMVARAQATKMNVLLVIDGFPRNVSEARLIPNMARGNPVQVIEFQLSDSELNMRRKQGNRGRENDDSDQALKIRLESYRNKFEHVVKSLEYDRIPLARIHSIQGNPETTFENLLSLIPHITHRVPIPPRQPRQTIAGKHLTEVGAIARATVFQIALRLAQSTRLYQQFFGTHPISLTRSDLPRVRRFPYLVALKASGERYMCLVHAKRLWFISRKMRVFTGPENDKLGSFECTLLDGELIDDKYFLVLDCLATKGTSCKSEPILERLRLSVELGTLYYNGPIFFRPQEYNDRTQLPQMLNRTDKLPWKTDGVILQPAKLPYRLGIDYNMFKWKPLGQNTVDFFYSEEDDGLYCRLAPNMDQADLPLISNGQSRPIDLTHNKRIVYKKTSLIKFGRLLPQFKPSWLRHAMIIECVALAEDSVPNLDEPIIVDDWGPNELIWVPQMHRGDKPSANIEWVAQSVIQSILDNVTEDELKAECVGKVLKPDQLQPNTAVRIPHSKKRARN
jgi:adenylate kinase family enzyme